MFLLDVKVLLRLAVQLLLRLAVQLLLKLAVQLLLIGLLFIFIFFFMRDTACFG